MFYRKQPTKAKMGQAIAELAIAGAILIMLLGYLLQQGYIYNVKQALEMYTFRKAMELSHEQERGIVLTVIRDVIVPSFFTGLNRQRTTATASVEYNPYLIYEPKRGTPRDIGTRQLIQINELMIQEGRFIEVPPTLITIEKDGEEVTRWEQSKISELDSQENKRSTTTYEYLTDVSENEVEKTLSKYLRATEDVHTIVKFTPADEVRRTLEEDDPGATVTVGEVPQDLEIVFSETTTKEKAVTAPH